MGLVCLDDSPCVLGFSIKTELQNYSTKCYQMSWDSVIGRNKYAFLMLFLVIPLDICLML